MRPSTFLLAVYALVITVVYYKNRPSSLCLRDFVDIQQEGSCLCNSQPYCVCTPSLAVDCIIQIGSDAQPELVFAQRSDGRGLAMVGGFLKVGESAEQGVRREVLEETGLELHSLEQWCVFSDPTRDPRRHTAALVFVGKSSLGIPHAGDDAKAVRTISVEDMARNPEKLAFDHGSIVAAYLQRFHKRHGSHLKTLSRQISDACPS